MPNGLIYQITAADIASHQARDFAKRRKAELGLNPEQFLDLFRAEYSRIIKDNTLILDWAENNMEWEDVSGYAEILNDPIPGVDLHEGWINAPKVIVTKGDDR